LSAFEKALELAKETADEPLIGRLRAERQECRLALGLPPDEEDRLAERRPFFRAGADQLPNRLVSA
jgi:hypothetical protein